MEFNDHVKKLYSFYHLKEFNIPKMVFNQLIFPLNLSMIQVINLTIYILAIRYEIG